MTTWRHVPVVGSDGSGHRHLWGYCVESGCTMHVRDPRDGGYEAARRRLENDLAAIIAEARAEQAAEVERLRTVERAAVAFMARWDSRTYTDAADMVGHCWEDIATLRAALAVTPEPTPVEPYDEADDMCPNCQTPWKCNGPHLADQTPRALSEPRP